MIKLTSNPFFILRASPRDNSQRLSELCDENSFLGNAAECADAYSVLCDPHRRLEAEVYWFTGIYDSKIYEVLKAIDSIKLDSIKNLNPVLQATILLSRKTAEMDYRSSTHCELLVSLYAYDIQTLLNEININRKIAGFPQVSDKNELSGYVSFLRREILKRAFKPLEYIGIERACGEMSRFMRERCSYVRALLYDTADFYRALASHRLEKLRFDIDSICKSITNQVIKIIDDNRIAALVSLITEYAVLDEPLLVHAELTGNPNNETELLVQTVRALYYSLNDYFNCPEKALRMAKLLHSKFCMIYDVAQVEPKLIQILESNAEMAAEKNRVIYEDETIKAREKEIRDAEEYRKQQAQEARQRELENIEARKTNEREIREKTIKETAQYAKQRAEEARQRELELHRYKKVFPDAVAIDFTHSHYAAAIFDKDRPEFIPCKKGHESAPLIIAINNDNKKVYFGREAETKYYDRDYDIFRFGINELNTKLYRSRYSPKLLCNLLFQRIKKDAERHISAQVKDIIAVVPVGFSSENKNLLMEAAEQSGLDIIRCVTATNAQAMAYAYDNHKDEKMILIDIGMDSISIASFDKGDGVVVPVSEAAVEFGSRRFINDISAYVYDKYLNQQKIHIKDNSIAWHRLYDSINHALYEFVAAKTDMRIDLPYFVGNEHLMATLHKNEIIGSVEPLMHSMLRIVESVSANVGKCKILIGGNIINIGFIKDYLQGKLHRDIFLYASHGENCAFGAALLAGRLSGKQSEILLLHKRV